VGKINVCDKIMIKNKKNSKKYGIEFLQNLHLKDAL